MQSEPDSFRADQLCKMWWLLISLLPATALAAFGCGSDRKDVKKKKPPTGSASKKSSKSSKSSKSRKDAKSKKSQKSRRSSKSGSRKSSKSKSSKSVKSRKSKQVPSKSSRSDKSCKKPKSVMSEKSCKGPKSVRTATKTASAESLSKEKIVQTAVSPTPAKIVEVRAEPQELSFNSVGGLQTFRFVNDSDERRAFKVKCSDNQLYRVSPVYGIVEPHQVVSIDILRQNGASKVDKLILITAAVDAGSSKPSKEILAETPVTSCQMTVIPLIVEA